MGRSISDHNHSPFFSTICLISSAAEVHRESMCEITRSQQQTTMEQNNFAVSQIETGAFKAAIQTLQNALKTYRQGMANADGCPLQGPSQTSLDECMTRESQITYGGREDYQQGSDRYIYREPILIPASMASISGSCIMASAMVIFNTALAHQLLSESEQNQVLLYKAAKLYELGFKLVLNNEQSESSVFFSMVVVNNLGAIYHKIDDKDTSDKFFQCLLSSLMFLVQGNDFVVCATVDGFFWNVSAADQCRAPPAA
jgi:hypothetical protein